MIEAYDYLGSIELHKNNNVASATEYFQKVLKLDPNNQRAKEFMATLREAGSPARGKGK